MDWDTPEYVDPGLRAQRLKRVKLLVQQGRFTIGRGSSRGRAGRSGGRNCRGRGLPLVSPPSAIETTKESSIMAQAKDSRRTNMWQPKSARALDIDVTPSALLPEPKEIMAGLDDGIERPHLPLLSATNYESLGELGKGQFGIVTKARLRNESSEKIVAKKQLLFDFDKEGFPLEALREITLLSSLRHPNIVSMEAVAYGGGDALNKWYLIMEPAGYELTTFIKGARRRPFRESQVKHLMLQLLRALSALHSAWVMHRDLKPANLLVDDHGVLRLCDFGLARRVCCGPELFEYENTSSREKIGSSIIDGLYNDLEKTVISKNDTSSSSVTVYATHTPNVISGHYRPPEVLLGSRDYGRSVDVWSSGCIFGELLSRSVLFAGKDEPDQLRQIFAVLGEPTDDDWPLYTHLAKARGFKFESSSLPDLQRRAARMGGSDMLRRRFPANGFDGVHPPISSMAFVSPLTHVITALSNTGFALLTRLLEKNPDRRITADAAKRDRWFSTKPIPEPLRSDDIQPLLQLASLADIAGAQTGATVPQFATTGFSSVTAPPLFLLAQQAGNAAVAFSTFSNLPTAASLGKDINQNMNQATAIAIAQARAVALAASSAAAQHDRRN